MHLLQAEKQQDYTATEEYVSTQASHKVAVERVIQTMHSYLAEPLSLEDMADIACLSPFYFNRVFHQRIGIPPGEFLATLRLNAAKKLLLTTRLSVTEICFSVGYNALGSFTTRFTQLVGVPPRRLRHLAGNQPVNLSAIQRRVVERASLRSFSPWQISGQIYSSRPVQGTIFIGLFPKPIPQGRPVTCTLLTAPGPFRLEPIPAGRWYLMVAAISSSPDPLAYLLPTSTLLVGMAGPLSISPVILQQELAVYLRPLCLTDPPIISALPYL
jgi:AraC-like DNA-binding protein